MENENIDSVNSDININREKRIRKTVSRLSDVYDKNFEMKSDRVIKPVSGNGIKLGDIKRIQDASHRTKINGELAKNIHLLCYRTIGKANKRLSSIKKFNGFDESDEIEFKKRLSLIDKMKMEDLKLICDLFNVHPSGKMKKDIANGLIVYLRCPFETGSENFRTTALRRKVKGKNKSKGKSEKKKKELNSEEDEVSMGSSHSEIEGDDQFSEQKMSEKEQNDPQIPKKSNGKISESQTDKKVMKEKVSIKKINEIVHTNQNPNQEENSEISDELLKEKITAILSGADLSKITLNQVCDGVVDQFPNVDLVLRRPHIKSLVKEVIDQAS